MKKLPAKITIGRTSGYDESKPIFIEIIDEDSSCQAVRVDLSLENFALAVTGLGHVDCEMEWNDSDLIGKKREWKTEQVVVPATQFNKKEDEKRAREAIAKYEIDGWVGRVRDLMNWHNHIKGTNLALVHYERWVEK